MNEDRQYDEGGPVIHSWRDVFNTNWRIHSFMGWRPNIPGGVDGIMVAYFMVGLVSVLVLGYVPLFGSLINAVWWPLPHIIVPAYIAMIATAATPDDRSAYRYAMSRLGLHITHLRLPELAPRGERVPVRHDETAAGPVQPGSVTGPVHIEFNRPVRLTASKNGMVAVDDPNGETGPVVIGSNVTLKVR